MKVEKFKVVPIRGIQSMRPVEVYTDTEWSVTDWQDILSVPELIWVCEFFQITDFSKMLFPDEVFYSLIEFYKDEDASGYHFKELVSKVYNIYFM